MSAEKVLYALEKWFEHNSSITAEKYNMLLQIVKHCLEDIDITSPPDTGPEEQIDKNTPKTEEEIDKINISEIEEKVRELLERNKFTVKGLLTNIYGQASREGPEYDAVTQALFNLENEGILRREKVGRGKRYWITTKSSGEGYM